LTFDCYGTLIPWDEGFTLGLAAGLQLEDIVEVISQTPAGLGHIATTWPEKALKDDPAPAYMQGQAQKHGREDWTTGIFRTLRGLQA
jgi:3-hydroxyisobutyrate dehydrogenase-like beta-hydroxyacid dehydrogenase